MSTALENDPGTGAPTPQRLAALLALATPKAEPWAPEELKAIFEYQMSQPPPGAADVGRAACKCFLQLLRHPQPPLALLKLSKEFAKTSRADPVYALPERVLASIYYLSIAAALVRCQARISSLSNPQLAQGFARVAAEPWMNAEFKELLREALQAVA